MARECHDNTNNASWDRWFALLGINRSAQTPIVPGMGKQGGRGGVGARAEISTGEGDRDGAHRRCGRSKEQAYQCQEVGSGPFW